MDSYQNIMVNGNEAVAWGALCSNIDYFAHYPGSPINMVEPAIKKLVSKFNMNIAINDSLNEHIAALCAAGASYCGARSLVVMKHVGVNIAADPFNYLGYTGVKGGMVIVVGTDPGANSSTGEEDTHWYAPQFNFPLFEPTSVREIFDYVVQSYELSEKYSIPVLIFIPGRLCYNSDSIQIPDHLYGNLSGHSSNPIYYFKKDNKKYINVGKRAIQNHRGLLERLEKLSQNSNYSKKYFNSKAKSGLITRGLTFGNVYESVIRLGIQQKVHLLNLDLVFPVNADIVRDFVKGKNEVTIIEDQDGFLEFHIKAVLFNKTKCLIRGKEFFPKYGEIVFKQVSDYLSNLFNIKPKKYNFSPCENIIPERLGTFCEGCPHRASFYAIERALQGTEGVIGGDIGCSSLPPFRADWLMCMNAGIGISQGMSHILSRQTVISTGGESTFFHGGIISLQNAVLNRINMIHIVFDNRVIGMTGRQASPTTRKNVNYKKLLKSIGVDRLSVVSAFKPSKFAKVLKKEIQQKGVRVIWVNTPCAQTPDLAAKLKRHILLPFIDSTQCRECTLCYDKLCCPAIYRTNEKNDQFNIDTARCMRCGTCRDICPNNAVKTNFAAPLPKLVSGCVKLIFNSLK
ncbi:MAG: indolepyruvate ferredoxin oxidoreductase subunit alpha [Desulfobacteraceae bacterium]|nr:indolepyruvate ferredoxin oxidoreductase subunit alpha [Desulfobacteraceae bacterium]